MPFQSKSQQRWMFANKPEMAKEWADHTPDIKALPDKAGKPKKKKSKPKQAKEGTVLNDLLDMVDADGNVDYYRYLSTNEQRPHQISQKAASGQITPTSGLPAPGIYTGSPGNLGSLQQMQQQLAGFDQSKTPMAQHYQMLAPVDPNGLRGTANTLGSSVLANNGFNGPGTGFSGAGTQQNFGEGGMGAKMGNLGGWIGGGAALPFAALASASGHGGAAGRVVSLGRRLGHGTQNMLGGRNFFQDDPNPPGAKLRKYTEAEIFAMPEFADYADRYAADPNDLMLDMSDELAQRYQDLSEGVPIDGDGDGQVYDGTPQEKLAVWGKGLPGGSMPAPPRTPMPKVSLKPAVIPKQPVYPPTTSVGKRFGRLQWTNPTNPPPINPTRDHNVAPAMLRKIEDKQPTTTQLGATQRDRSDQVRMGLHTSQKPSYLDNFFESVGMTPSRER